MKTTLFIFSIFSSLSFFGQIVTKEFFKIKTYGKNEKTIIFHEESIDLKESFLIIALNKSSNDFTRCSWKVKLSVDCLKEMYHALNEISFDDNSQITFKNFSIKVKNSKVKLMFFHSSCSSEHSTSYFQKSCNRELSFVINSEQINSFVQFFHYKLFNTIAVK